MERPQFFNSRFSGCKTPFGAVKQGETVTLTLFTPCEMGIEHPRLVLFQDGHPFEYHIMQPAGEQDGSRLFSIQLTLHEIGLYFYYFDLWKDYTKIFRDNLGNGYMSWEDGNAWQITVYDPSFKTPDFLKGGVIYQIFPDRFFEGVEKDSMPFADRIYRENKQAEPYFWPTENPEGYLNMDYFGGDLEGIRQKLPYLHELGVTCIYLNPIFEAHANHRYNTANYMKIDPLLGTEEDFKTLCREAKQLGIAIVLDGVFSHTGSDSLYFNKEGRYGTGGAYHDLYSPFRSWYDFSNNYTCGYRSWWGFETLPEVNENDPAYRNFICGKDGVIDHWLKCGASGFRLDVADELPDDFIEEIRKAVKRNGEDNYLLGEVWEDATTKFSYGSRRRYLLGKGLDAVMNYPFRNAVMDFLKGADGGTVAGQLMDICENYPAPALHTLMNFLSTHDTERAITWLVGEPANGRDRFWQSERRLSRFQYECGITLMQLAFVMIFTLPGIPSVYYGDEIAMQGYRDPFNRGYYQWNCAENRLKPLVQQLCELRKQHDAFYEGSFEIVRFGSDFLHYRRVGKTSCADVFINRSQTIRPFYWNNKTYSVGARRFKIKISSLEPTQTDPEQI